LIVFDAEQTQTETPDLVLAPHAHVKSDAPSLVGIVKASAGGHDLRWPCSTLAYWPVEGLEFVEIAARDASPARARAFDLFMRAGYKGIVSCARGRFASDRLISAYLSPVARFVSSGGGCDDAAHTLREFGFVRPLAALSSSRPEAEQLTDLAAAQPERGRDVPALLSAVLLSLLDSALELLKDGSLEHVSQLDVLAREVIDFPLGRGSLGRYLNPTNVSSRIDELDPSGGELLSERALERAHRYVRDGRPFYR
ncbi:MAG TPA: hypothetical protein VK524_01680, partial [Polyangiaceae bacterium]|nr:hypothetical protein [Polyangiaceae bacterium]